jgi:hypothetical protein
MALGIEIWNLLDSVAVAVIFLPHEHRSMIGKNIHYPGFASREAVITCDFGRLNSQG